MATQCASSARLALPTMLRGVLRSEFCANSRAPSVHRFARPRTLHPRFISSTPRFSQIEAKPPGDVISELATPQSLDQHAKEPKTAADSTAPSPEATPAPTTSSDRAQKSTTSPKNKDRKYSEKEQDRRKAKKALKKSKPEHWQVQKSALEKKFPTGWNPQKKLSPDALDGIRHLHATAPDRFTSQVLADEFKVSPEAIRRILKSKWRPSATELESKRKRWENRHERIWSRMAELGLRPSTKRSRPMSDANTLFKEE